jgi:UDP-N-acetylglucosamine diphosphorylase/glucosamine-1-phosphate N-acetyltransferase
MNIILFDDNQRTDLLPLCFTRPIGDLRVGILTIKEKWEKHLDSAVSFLTQDYLRKKFPASYSSDNLYINGRLLPNASLIEEILRLDEAEGLHIEKKQQFIAFRSSTTYSTLEQCVNEIEFEEINCTYSILDQVTDIFNLNAEEIKNDFELLTSGRESEPISSTNTVIGNEIFLEKGAKIEAAVLNSNDGPIYIGTNAEIMEGSLVRGPFAMCEHSTIKMGAKIYGGTTIGPECKVGGEVSNVVFQGYSNKGHDGFLGNAVIGEWCNLGADTNSSNLKNNYASVKIWNYGTKRFANTGLQFCGLIMGDHSKCGINTMFNTGTVVGVSANIFGAGFPRNFIPSFTWGGATGFSTYALAKAYETAEKVMERRNLKLIDIEKEILKHIFDTSKEHRFWENQPVKI